MSNTKYKVYSFEKLDVYTSAMNLSLKIRRVIAEFPMEERFGLSDQLRRAIDSVPSNLAEGLARAGNYDQARFTNIAYSSMMEVVNHLNLSYELKYINEEDYVDMRLSIDEIVRQLNSLYKYQVNNKKDLKNKI
ncbi:four helix bundle protein [Riemerella anatipestifer]|uniref:four helix bundle protein n=1 Tax=Riemerella anatipestifer TaxID=34085 RepID=UPI00208FBDCA|nr:four helix bundle protein [Riemerella anatipestifer]MCO4303038.1 four helix bundle protein [Riemerella anatipestifer]MCO7353170.1 four helix bundle protein [Riemerella anatipestifer]MCQ4038584.1 four helix bundle protein [Riemerella anatipestifer]MCT6760127.1 four helix bundle protein [Riemerella anatipestifer]MCT6767399.1 four helix bundle protein [Riemerella anatipestifer]